MCLNYIFMSEPLITPCRKTTLIWKKNFLNRSFLKTMVGTFCATCTVTWYPCYELLLFSREFLPVYPGDKQGYFNRVLDFVHWTLDSSVLVSCFIIN